MWMDIIQLQDWYRTRSGRVARRVLQGYLDERLPNMAGPHIITLGYAAPFLKNLEEEPFVFCAMPAQMGVCHWPRGGRSKSLLVWDGMLPFSDDSLDFIFVVHALEFAADAERVLEECWRVLRPDGRLLVMVPNRTGAWARKEGNPLARGRPFSARELDKLMRNGHFVVTHCTYALYTPPTNRTWLLRYAKVFEKIGQRWSPAVGGMLVMEGRKDVFGGRVVRVSRDTRRNMVQVPALSST